jgi:hypothetical protein
MKPQASISPRAAGRGLSSMLLPFAVGFASALLSCWPLSAGLRGAAIVVTSASLRNGAVLQLPQFTHTCRDAAYSCLGALRAEAGVQCPVANDENIIALSTTRLDSAVSRTHDQQQSARRTTFWSEQVMGFNGPTGVPLIDDWLEQGDAAAAGTLLKLQSDNLGIRGHIAEIGVEHGKFLIWMALHTRLGERALGFDLFDLESSGSSLAEVRKHSTYYAEPDAIEAFSVNSMRLPLCFFREQRVQNLIRFFSITSGQSVDHVYENCWSAWSTLSPGGVIAITDFLHNVKVLQGAQRFLDANADARAFLLGPNKLFICHSMYYKRYFDAMSASLPSMSRHTVEFGAAKQLVMPPSKPVTLYGWLLPAILERDREVWHCSMISEMYAPPVYNEVCDSREPDII